MPQLTNKSADALCTVITFGFFSLEGMKVILQSEPPKEVGTTAEEKQAAKLVADKEAAEYKKVVEAYKQISKKNLLCDQSFSQSYMPYVLAKAPLDDEGVKAGRALVKVIPIIGELFDGAKIPNPPYGAYIGGILKGNQFIIVGPSALLQYKPTYRQLDDPARVEIEGSYNRAKNATNCSYCIISRLPKSKSNEESPTEQITIDKCIETISEDYDKTKGLFASYHGMIRTMSQFLPDERESDAIFEVALGSSTTKVSSCLPCSLFMMANGRPASSTHLGRGDNWGIPAKCPKSMINAWRNHVIDYYKEGLKLFESADNKFPAIVDLMFDFQQEEQNIPKIFLEALTFESKFTDRILKTLASKR
ncbi:MULTISPECIES: hypothetical protein [Bacteroides]|uniref:hypothetical protein n=1 Tax=Bacteroides TaxID=816 RepID=UPI0013EC7BA9|nr:MULTISPECIES: hypothetical protein [Bacteroides]MBV4192548.1 hypothetical protein [Bacteroides fragilis]MCE8627036.1 hypothetical protein [Bacteroides fragilis]MCY6337191.1 hypothetical protein [Bacteroides fragilis]MDV6149100.1 hypothetical protein [Bacteroides hominis (ex Liu et al. 2022)]QTO27435.1 hypothetical protein G7Y45_07790 [Bacteroides sp. ZJ-18]